MHPDPSSKKNRNWWNDTSDGYQNDHGGDLSVAPEAWGTWRVSEQTLSILGDLHDRDVLEFGCGAAQWAVALAERGIRVVGMDLSERQLGHAKRLVTQKAVKVPLVQANAECVPLADESFDVVFCDFGAMTYARPQKTVAEASRLLRPGGLFAFSMSTPLRDICWDRASDSIAPRLSLNYFELDRLEDEDCVSFQLPYGEWIRLFRRHRFTIEDLVEVRPQADTKTSYADYVPLEWARRWPAENIWKLRKELGE